MTTQWLTTTKAAEKLGITPHTLRLWAKKDKTPFISGVHYMPKTAPTASYRWNVERILDLFLEMGNRAVAAEQILKNRDWLLE